MGLDIDPTLVGHVGVTRCEEDPWSGGDSVTSDDPTWSAGSVTSLSFGNPPPGSTDNWLPQDDCD